MLATEAMMKALAKKFESDKQEEWGMAGLLHDGDYSEEVPVEKQGIQISEWLDEKGFEIPETVKHAMAAHNMANTGVKPESKMDWALFCGDSLTGLIVASALVLPERKLVNLTVESIMKRYKEPKFAAGTRREEIKMCEDHLGISLEEFVRITLQAMQEVHERIGL
ncbi:MAG: phosphohydrolase [Candidatus Daviesbacteria bacterium]|nr:phosphohydrolase [Candidatus Daviesbacteria bacterium]